ncbi:uncharacterized protein [Diabrotica undecimpunctata]|uniref:uncharacterized protein n=1 Tax=Diabrotica undecimpunctata TaxID=50387 RepID=UPI003B6395BF
MEIKQEIDENICKIEIVENEVCDESLDMFKIEIKEESDKFGHVDVKEWSIKTEIDDENKLKPLEEKQTKGKGFKKNLKNSVAKWGKAKVAYIAEQSSYLKQESKIKLEIMQLEADKKMAMMQWVEEQNQKEYDIRMEMIRTEIEHIRKKMKLMQRESYKRLELMQLKHDLEINILRNKINKY